jgi:cell division protein FtsB
MSSRLIKYYESPSTESPGENRFKELFNSLSGKSSSSQKQELEKLRYLYDNLYGSYKDVQQDLERCKREKQKQFMDITELEADLIKYKNTTQPCKDDYLVEHIKMMFEKVVMDNVELDSRITMLKRTVKNLQEQNDILKEKCNITEEKSGMEQLDNLLLSLQDSTDSSSKSDY